MSYAYNVTAPYNNFILEIVKTSGCQNYLELGVADGANLTPISKIVPYSIGVDIEDLRADKSTNLYIGTTDSFFEQNTKIFDIVFIDADHRVEAVKKDFENSIKILNEFGIILLHDTDPTEIMLTADKFCSNSYQIIDYIKQQNKYNLVVFPFGNAGLTVVQRNTDLRVKKYL